MTSANTVGLSETHRHSLVLGSGIAEGVINGRGYRTVDKKQQLKDLGFAQTQLNVPALLIPVIGVDGTIVGYQARPDQPRIKDGKSLKYETTAGMKMRLDVHPLARPMIGDPHVPLFITEGIKKGDALVSQGLCAVALLGVWNFRGTNDDGGKTVLADWEHGALNDRRVYIVFDSDVMTNPAVHQALVRLDAVLKSRGAN
jgi:Domain of unknown function (DUF3854)